MITILDAGPLVAMLNRMDEYHEWAVNQAQMVKEPFHSCEAVLAEAHFLLSGIPAGNRRLNALLQASTADVSFAYRENIEGIGELMRKYESVPMSFADACLVRMAELQDRSRVFTVDSDFRIYRKNRNQRIELLIP